ncbi:ASKHA domain-containing protein [Pelolinea submarina]|uniref:Uncharacterized 2Fe-2S/4Fe-4S cluster protein (DUF4445 family) n=1 Tax=Pelolinea submarina TaxID=913107 RepID=A0A347ZR66_9CHLR|nr:ASKHA domain-containing protein [Pelolinea submarina]REG11649.1 uncharacterized 2Fe-2S/4Fe-4S cluster protein (DUF4445 family) [Pelolinea submarina]BBB47797.1 hypothetical protein Pelsub_P1024 [Pelolinea submarina]
MSFTIEFQPTGQRLVAEEALTVLAAARQAGLQLRSDCGGEGTCGKCVVRFIEFPPDLPVRPADERHLSARQLSQGYRLACSAVIDRPTQLFIPPESLPAGQVLQTGTSHKQLSIDPALRQMNLQAKAADLHNLQADFDRIRDLSREEHLTADMDVLRELPDLLRRNAWRVNLIMRGSRLQHVTPQPLSPLAGLAVDVGSTKLACYLLDLENGELLAVIGLPNPQVMFGEDIMARLAYAQKGEREALELHHVLMQSIQQALVELTKQSGLEPIQVAEVCLVGNTAMHHFYLNLPTGGLAVSPFVPVASGAQLTPAPQIGLSGMPGMLAYTPPVIAGFVGSDHLAFLLACGFGEDQRVRLGIDIGTNTEIALQKGERILSVSTASGPAFEGAHIRFGMRAAPGAIEHVHLDGGRFTCEVIGDTPASGICGSGILDALGELRAGGLLNQRGRLDKNHPLVKLDAQGKPYVTLAAGNSEDRPITLSQQDIDQVLLAKGAIRAGIDVLMDALKVSAQEIDEVLIAGAFGSYMLPAQAIRIGMLPEIPLQRIRAVGNAAGLGAQMMLVSQTTRRQAEALAARIEYLELTLYPDFEVFYANGIRA